MGICPKWDQIPPIYRTNLVLVNSNKNLGFGQTPPPPPLLGKKSQLLPKKIEGSPHQILTNKDLISYSVHLFVSCLSGVECLTNIASIKNYKLCH